MKIPVYCKAIGCVALVLLGAAAAICLVPYAQPEAIASLRGAITRSETTKAPKERITLLYDEYKAFLSLEPGVRRLFFKDPKYRRALAGTHRGRTPNLNNFKIGEEYEVWVTEMDPPRILNIPGIPNARDIGGWPTETGKRVKQGLIIRSAELNAKSYYGMCGRSFLTMQSLHVLLNDLGVKTDIDLRWDNEVAGMTDSPMGPLVTWKHCPYGLYQWIDEPSSKEQFFNIFRTLSNTNNLPALIHCVYGKDRTGTLCYLLEGALGVSDDDKLKDWEASGFYYEDPRFIHEKGIDGLLKYLRQYPGSTYNERCVAYIKSCGITQRDIDSFRALMLETSK